mmetsp:Transcript_11332/g.32688  ORF Transcript_11332/g.32688 Transcript_11332/m.32688 type:complete len:221 (-) Transcript_11332:366-1028(-)
MLLLLRTSKLLHQLNFKQHLQKARMWVKTILLPLKKMILLPEILMDKVEGAWTKLPLRGLCRKTRKIARTKRKMRKAGHRLPQVVDLPDDFAASRLWKKTPMKRVIKAKNLMRTRPIFLHLMQRTLTKAAMLMMNPKSRNRRKCHLRREHRTTRLLRAPTKSMPHPLWSNLMKMTSFGPLTSCLWVLIRTRSQSPIFVDLLLPNIIASLTRPVRNWCACA